MQIKQKQEPVRKEASLKGLLTRKPTLWDEKADVCLFEFLFVAKRSQVQNSLFSE